MTPGTALLGIEGPNSKRGRSDRRGGWCTTHLLPIGVERELLSKGGSLVMTTYCRPWYMTNLPRTFSKMAESPVGSEIARCTEPASPVGKVGAPRRNGSIRKASTASATVAKLSSTHCGQALIETWACRRLCRSRHRLGRGDWRRDLLVHAVGGAGLIGRGDQAAVFRGPFRRIEPARRRAACRGERPKDWCACRRSNPSTFRR